MLEQYSEIKVKRDRLDLGLPAGTIGTVIEVYTKPTEGYFVEFDEPYDEEIYVLGPGDLELVNGTGATRGRDDSYPLFQADEETGDDEIYVDESTSEQSGVLSGIASHEKLTRDDPMQSFRKRDKNNTGIPGKTSDDRLRRREVRSSESPVKRVAVGLSGERDYHLPGKHGVKWLLLGLFTLLIISLWVVQYRSPVRPPVTEGAPSANSPETVKGQRELTERLTKYPWTNFLPDFEENFEIEHLGGYQVKVTVYGDNADEESLHFNQALSWLRTQDAPMDELKIVLEKRRNDRKWLPLKKP